MIAARPAVRPPEGRRAGVVAIPTLEDLAADPARAADLPAEARSALLARAAAVLAALAAAPTSSPGVAPGSDPGVLLTVDDAAARLKMGRDFVYQHARELGAVRFGRALRFTEAGIAHYLARRPR